MKNFVGPRGAKLSSLCLALILFLSQVVLAHAAEANFWANRMNPLSGRSIIHIQDIHLNQEAQADISRTLRRLIEQKKVDLVALEAATDEIDVSVFRAYPYPAFLKKAANYLLKEHAISGPIHAALTSAAGLPPFVGVEDEQLYQANIEAYRAAVENREVYEDRLKTWQDQLEQDKKNTFNPALLELDGHAQAYHQGRLKMGPYLKALTQRSDRIEPQVELFLETWRLENQLDFTRVESDRARLLAHLFKKLTDKEKETLQKWSFASQKGQVKHADFYRHIQTLCERHQINLSRFPFMRSYGQYTFLADAIEVERLMTQIRRLERHLYHTLAKTEKEKRLVQESRTARLVAKLLSFSLTPQEWEEYKETPPDLPTSWGFEAFYEHAESRNQALASNLLKAMDRHNAQTAVLVTGGFHTHGLNEIFQKEGITPVTLTPRITKLAPQDSSSYLSAFTREKTPVEQIFEGKKLFLARPPAPLVSYVKLGSILLAEPVRQNRLGEPVENWRQDALNTTSIQNHRLAEKQGNVVDIPLTVHGTTLNSRLRYNGEDIRTINISVTQEDFLPPSSIGYWLTGSKKKGLAWLLVEVPVLSALAFGAAWVWWSRGAQGLLSLFLLTFVIYHTVKQEQWRKLGLYHGPPWGMALLIHGVVFGLYVAVVPFLKEHPLSILIPVLSQLLLDVIAILRMGNLERPSGFPTWVIEPVAFHQRLAAGVTTKRINLFYSDPRTGVDTLDGVVVPGFPHVQETVSDLVGNYERQNDRVQVDHVLLNGNLGLNEWHFVYHQGRLYTNQKELSETQSTGRWSSDRVYSVFVQRNDNQPSTIQKVKLQNFEMDDQTDAYINGKIISVQDGRDISDHVDLAFSGQQIVEGGTSAPIAEWAHQLVDMNHLFTLPRTHDASLGRDAYPGTRALLDNPSLIQQALNQKPIDLSLDDLPMGSSAHEALQRVGYTSVDSPADVVSPGQYCLKSNNQSVFIRLKPGVNPLGLIGIRKGGHGQVDVIKIPGESRVSGATLKEAQAGLEGSYEQVLLVSQGRDVGDAGENQRKNATSAIFVVTDLKEGRQPRSLESGLTYRSYYEDEAGVKADVEIFEVDLDQWQVEQFIDERVRTRDFKENDLVVNDGRSGYTAQEIAEQDPLRGEGLLVLSGSQGDFRKTNTLVVQNGQVVTREPGARDLEQLEGAYKPPEGPFWVLGLGPDEKDVFPLDLESGHVPVQEGMGGLLLLKDGVNQLEWDSSQSDKAPRFGAKPALSGQDIWWKNADERLSLSAMGYNADGKLVVVQMVGNPDDATPSEPTPTHLVETLSRLGVRDAILTAISGNVQRWSSHLVPASTWARGRATSQIQTKLAVPMGPNKDPIGPRRLGHALKFKKIASRPSQFFSIPHWIRRSSESDALYEAQTLQHLHVGVFAGGLGTRLEPVNKISADLLDPGRTNIELTQSRIVDPLDSESDSGLVPNERFYAITTLETDADVRDALGHTAIPEGNILTQPSNEDTMGCLFRLMAEVSLRDPHGLVATLNVDHKVPETALLHRDLTEAAVLARRTNGVVMLGSRPPADAPLADWTRFGILDRGQRSRQSSRAWKLDAMVEKPSPAKATQLKNDGQSLWSTGYMVAPVSVLEDTLERLYGHVYFETYRKYKESLRTGNRDNQTKFFKRLHYAFPKKERPFNKEHVFLEPLTEAAKKSGWPPVLAWQTRFSWFDIGTWPSLLPHLEAQEGGHYTVGEAEGVNVQQSPGALIVTQGRQSVFVNNLPHHVVVATPDTLMVVPLSRADEVPRLRQQRLDHPDERVILVECTNIDIVSDLPHTIELLGVQNVEIKTQMGILEIQGLTLDSGDPHDLANLTVPSLIAPLVGGVLVVEFESLLFLQLSLVMFLVILYGFYRTSSRSKSSLNLNVSGVGSNGVSLQTLEEGRWLFGGGLPDWVIKVFYSPFREWDFLSSHFLQDHRPKNDRDWNQLYLNRLLWWVFMAVFSWQGFVVAAPYFGMNPLLALVLGFVAGKIVGQMVINAYRVSTGGATLTKNMSGMPEADPIQEAKELDQLLQERDMTVEVVKVATMHEGPIDLSLAFQGAHLVTIESDDRSGSKETLRPREDDFFTRDIIQTAREIGLTTFHHVDRFSLVRNLLSTFAAYYRGSYNLTPNNIVLSIPLDGRMEHAERFGIPPHSLEESALLSILNEKQKKKLSQEGRVLLKPDDPNPFLKEEKIGTHTLFYQPPSPSLRDFVGQIAGTEESPSEPALAFVQIVLVLLRDVVQATEILKTVHREIEAGRFDAQSHLKVVQIGGALHAGTLGPIFSQAFSGSDRLSFHVFEDPRIPFVAAGFPFYRSVPHHFRKVWENVSVEENHLVFNVAYFKSLYDEALRKEMSSLQRQRVASWLFKGAQPLYRLCQQKIAPYTGFDLSMPSIPVQGLVQLLSTADFNLLQTASPMNLYSSVHGYEILLRLLRTSPYADRPGADSFYRQLKQIFYVLQAEETMEKTSESTEPPAKLLIALSLNMFSPVPWLTLADFHLSRNNQEAADSAIRVFLLLLPDTPVKYNLVSYVLLTHKLYEKVRALLQTAYDRGLKDYPLLFDLACMHSNMGHISTALQLMREARTVSLEPVLEDRLIRRFEARLEPTTDRHFHLTQHRNIAVGVALLTLVLSTLLMVWLDWPVVSLLVLLGGLVWGGSIGALGFMASRLRNKLKDAPFTELDPLSVRYVQEVVAYAHSQGVPVRVVYEPAPDDQPAGFQYNPTGVSLLFIAPWLVHRSVHAEWEPTRLFLLKRVLLHERQRIRYRDSRWQDEIIFFSKPSHLMQGRYKATQHSLQSA